MSLRTIRPLLHHELDALASVLTGQPWRGGRHLPHNSGSALLGCPEVMLCVQRSTGIERFVICEEPPKPPITGQKFGTGDRRRFSPEMIAVRKSGGGHHVDPAARQA